MMMMNVMIVITVLILIMIMIRNLMIMITMMIVMTMITMMMAKSPLQGHGKQGENGDTDREAGGEGVEAARSFLNLTRSL